MVLHVSEITQLTTEEREMLKDRLMDENFVRIEDDLARAPRKDDPKKLIGPNLARLVRYLLFWDGKGQLGDNKTHKTDAEFEDDLGMKRDALKSARELGEAEGVLEYERGTRPGDRRRTTVYHVNVAGLTRKITDSEIGRAERDLRALEGNTTKWAERQREYLGKRLTTLRETRDLIERIFGEPETDEHCDLPDFEDCFECDSTGVHEVWCSLYDEPEPDGHEDGAPTDADAPLLSNDTPDWLPDGMDTGTYGDDVNEETRSLECVNPQFNVWENHALQQSTNIRERHEVARESFVNTQDSLGESSLALLPPGEDQGPKEPMSTTSTPSVADSLDGEGTEEVVSTTSPETTPPMSAREAWAMYERGEVSLEQLTALCKPARGEQEEVVA